MARPVDVTVNTMPDDKQQPLSPLIKVTRLLALSEAGKRIVLAIERYSAAAALATRRHEIAGGTLRWYQSRRQAAQLFRFYRAFLIAP